MGTIIQNFQRYEIKYLLDERQYREFRDRTRMLLIPDAYGESDICNCYLDTKDHRLIRNSLEKGIYKEKLRLRSYGVPAADQDTTFLELKKKYDGVVYKRREVLTYAQAMEVLKDRGQHSFADYGLDSQIYREIEWVMKYYEELLPMMVISYQRVAMYEPSDTEHDGLRVTFDRNLLWRTEAVDLKEGIYGDPILPYGYRIMEVKAAGAMPMWLVHILDDMRLYPTSFSKYGRAYETSMRIQRKIA